MKNSLLATLYYTTTSEALPPTHITITLSLAPSRPPALPQKKVSIYYGTRCRDYTYTNFKKEEEREDKARVESDEIVMLVGKSSSRRPGLGSGRVTPVLKAHCLLSLSPHTERCTPASPVRPFFLTL